MSLIASTRTPTIRWRMHCACCHSRWRRSARFSICGMPPGRSRTIDDDRVPVPCADGLSRADPGAPRLRDLRPIAQSLAVGIRRALVFSEQAAARIRTQVLVSRVPAARRRVGVAGDERVDRDADRRLQPRRGDTCRLCAGATQAAMAWGDSARVPAAAGRAELARLRQYRAGVLPDRAQRHDPGRRAGPRLTWIGARGVDRVGGVRLGGYVARGSLAQPRRLAVDLLPDRHAAARGPRPHRERDLRLPRIARRVHRHVLCRRARCDDAPAPDVQCHDGRQLSDLVDHRAPAADTVDRLHAHRRALPQGRRARNGRPVAIGIAPVKRKRNERAHGAPSLTIAGSVATIRFERPREHNRIDPDDIPVLRAHLERVAAAAHVRVVVSTGAGGKTFSSAFTIDAILDRLDRSFEDLLDAVERFPLPTIAVLNGGVYGGATDLALACDMRIGVTDTRMFMPAARFGLHYYPGGLRRYVAAVGLSQAKRLFLTAQTIDADEMLRIGFLTELVEPKELRARVVQYIDAIRACEPGAVTSMKT